MKKRELLDHAARTDFMMFARLMFAELRPGRAFQDNWHLHAIATMLREAQLSREVRQLVTMPPRSLKSFMISVAFPAWLLGQDPATQIICATYGEKLSGDLSTDTARLMESGTYKRLFPRTRLASSAKLKLTTTKGGMRFATSIGGPTTGFGGDWVIVDDPINATDAHSASARETANRYFDRALSSRVNDETSARFIVVRQRLHANDVVGHLLKNSGWNELRLQAKATEPAWIDIGKRDMHEVRVGELLHAARLPQSVLDRKLSDMGSMDVQAQFQQDPVPATGNIVKQEWLQYYGGPLDLAGARVVLSLDTATKTDPKHDYSACTVWCSGLKDHRLVDVWREKVEYGLRLLPAFQSMEQIQGVYGDKVATNIERNCAVRLVLRPAGLPDAKKISEQLGTYTFKARSRFDGHMGRRWRVNLGIRSAPTFAAPPGS